MTSTASLDPARTAILAMDFQASILGFLPDPSRLLSEVGRAVAALRNAGGKVCFVRVGFTESEVAVFPGHSAMGMRIRTAGARMHADAPTTAVHSALSPTAGDVLVRKTRVGAFSTTDLDATLRAAGVDTLVLTGVHTSGVVLSTVREAHDLDYRLIVLSDGCADPEPEAQSFLLGQIFPKQATVMTTAQLVAQLRAEQAATLDQA